MTDDHTIPSLAQCLTCGYLLRGLREQKCPECGRPFDPLDPASFDADPPRVRRRRWLKRGALLLGAAVLIFALAPRGLVKGTLAFSCKKCGETVTVTRWELEPPRWTPFRYPGIAQTARSPAGVEPGALCTNHALGIRIAYQGGRGGSGGIGKITPPLGQVFVINGIEAVVNNANEVLNTVTGPDNMGLQLTIRARRSTDEEHTEP